MADPEHAGRNEHGIQRQSRLVTGGGSGIGRASALALAREGFAVVVAGRRPEPLQAVVGEIEGLQGKALGRPDRCRRSRPRSRRCSPRPRRPSGGSTCCSTMPASAPPSQIEDLAFDALEGVVDYDPRRLLPVHPAGLPDHEGPEADGRPDHQQRLDLGACAAAATRSPTPTAKHAITGLTKSTSLDGRKYDISCGQIDVGNALTEMTQRMTRGVPQPNGEVIDRADDGCRERRPRRSCSCATVTPEANVQFLTVMATKMPFVGRG